MTDKHMNVFISHHGKDDEHIGNLKELLAKKGYVLRNSSVDSTKPNEANDPNYIRQQLKSRIEWAGVTIVLIGKETHQREWVDWEIEESNRQGNRIVGVYIQGATDADVPEALEKYGDDLVGWQSKNIIDAIEGKVSTWEKTDGSPRERNSAARSNC